MGTVKGVKASAPEERLARALDQAGYQYLFRYSVGAPRGLPGWKELDFAVYAAGLVNPIEVDTAFTHRNKAASDQLHDAIIMNDFELKSMGMLAPSVRHADGDTELASMTNARQYVKKTFGTPTPQYTSLPEWGAPGNQTPSVDFVDDYSVDSPSRAQERAAAKQRAEYQAKVQYNKVVGLLNAKKKIGAASKNKKASNK